MDAYTRLSTANFRMAHDPTFYGEQAEQAKHELKDYFTAIAQKTDHAFPLVLPNGMVRQELAGKQAVYVSPESYNPEKVSEWQELDISYILTETEKYLLLPV